jgi:hypothetical protein
MRFGRRLLRLCVLGVTLTSVSAALLHAQPSPTAILDQIQANGTRPIDFHAAVFPETVYVGQQITYQVAVLLSESARARLRRNPEFLPPELRGVLAYELGSPKRVAPRNYGGGVFEAHVFQRALFAVAPGPLMVPAPQLSYALPQSSSYFSREEQFVVRAESAQLVVKALPGTGRPQDYTGAVGVWEASVQLDTAAARVGDPLLLTLRVEGIGNVKLLPRPAIAVEWASVVPATDRVHIDTSSAYVRGYKEFDWILTPTRAGEVNVPPLRYSYFNPYGGSYAYAETAPRIITVSNGVLATAAESDNVAVLPLRVWRGEHRWSLASTLEAWRLPLLLLLVVAPLPWLAPVIGSTLVSLAASRRGQTRDARLAATGLSGNNASQRSDPGEGGELARHTRRTILGALAQRLRVSPQDLVSRRDVERTLRRGGVTRETTTHVVALLDELAQRGFSNEFTPPRAAHDVAARADQLLTRVDAEAVRRPS